MQKLNWKYINRVFILVGTVLLILLTLNQSVWRDEAFSLNLVNLNFKDMLYMASLDVHPPLYYFLLKVFLVGFEFLSGTENLIIVSKLFSIIPWLLLVSFFTYQYNKEGKCLEAFIFNVCMFGTVFIPYSIEIRMYSWALLFVTVSAFYCLQIIKRGETKNWCLFLIFSMLSAYTHYYATVAVAFLYLVLLFTVVKNRKSYKPWLVVVGLSILIYLPWFLIALKQIFEKSGNYWIEPITISSLISYINFPFATGYPLFTISMFLIVLVVIVISIKKLIKLDRYLTLIGLGTPIFLTLVGIIVSVIIRPFFVARYMIPALGVFWLLIASMISNSKFKKSIVISIFLINVVTYSYWFNLERMRDQQYKQFSNYLVSTSDEYLVANQDLYVLLNYYVNVIDFDIKEVSKEELQENEGIIIDFNDLEEMNRLHPDLKMIETNVLWLENVNLHFYKLAK